MDLRLNRSGQKDQHYRRTLIKAAAVVSFILILLGVGIHSLGFRVAIQYSPELAREIGGVITAQEKDAIETS